MDVPNNVWTLAGDATPSSIILQNKGPSRIAYVFAATLPGPSAYVMDSDAHFTLEDQTPVNFKELDTQGLSVYVRNLGSTVGKLAVQSSV